MGVTVHSTESAYSAGGAVPFVALLQSNALTHAITRIGCLHLHCECVISGITVISGTFERY